jgi:NAD(P)-dependent dehydrogenase (short-subunit alcohol dehydrogenase family)
MDLGVADRLFVLIGGSRGMGWQTARILAQDGARIAIVTRNEAGARAAAERLTEEFGSSATGIAADATIDGTLDRAIALAELAQGPLAGLLITTGYTFPGDYAAQLSDAGWEACFQDVLMSAVRATRAAIPRLSAAGGGSIVTTAAYSAGVPPSNRAAYAACKAAIVNLTKNVALTHGREGIRANCVCPGAFETERSRARVDALCAEKGIDRVAAGWHLMQDEFHMPVALQRLGQPAESGELMAFLLSRRAGYLTGATINIDGGTDF